MPRFAWQLAATEAAFATLVAEHHAAMARVAYVICGDVEATRDAVQSAWTIAWRRLSSLRQPEQVHAWLVAIAANEARQHLRRQRRVAVVDLTEASDRHGGGDPPRSSPSWTSSGSCASSSPTTGRSSPCVSWPDSTRPRSHPTSA